MVVSTSLLIRVEKLCFGEEVEDKIAELSKGRNGLREQGCYGRCLRSAIVQRAFLAFLALVHLPSNSHITAHLT